MNTFKSNYNRTAKTLLILALAAQFLLQHGRRIRARHETGFEIKPWGEAQVGVRWAGETIDAAMLAAPVGVDRAVKG